MVFIIILAILFVLAIYKVILEYAPGFYNYLCLLVVIGVCALILAGIVLLFVRPTLAQKKRIKEAIKKDEDDSFVLRAQMEAKNVKIKEQIRMYREQLERHEAEVRANNVLAEKDKNLETVNWIIDQIESRRADSVKEALLLYDDKRRRDNAFELKRIQAKIEMDRQGREALANATRELNDTINRKIYENDMKRIEEKKLRELQEINEKLSN